MIARSTTPGLDRAAPFALPRRPRLGWLAPYFGTPGTAATSLGCLLLLAWLLPPLLQWAVVDAVFSGPRSACDAAAGACWAFLVAKFDFFLFGFYPADQRWRPALAILLVAAMLGLSLAPRFWRPRLVLGWLAVLLLGAWLMVGGLGLPVVTTEKWGGLPVSLMVTLAALLGGFPVGILLALGRRSPLRFISTLCVVIIELTRGVPLIALLFMVNVMVPLFLPAVLTPEKLARALLAYGLAAGAYFAEAIRGGLQALPPAQQQAAEALGLGPWTATRLVILPQALRIAIPPIANTVISFIKETSLVSVLGLFDLLGTIQLAARDPDWLIPGFEGYLLAAAIYLVACTAAAHYADWLERRLP